jgi:hypothetical protein
LPGTGSGRWSRDVELFPKDKLRGNTGILMDFLAIALEPALRLVVIDIIFGFSIVIVPSDVFQHTFASFRQSRTT